ncbi:MAG: hypothetical protein WC736_16330 [Gallionella sp.]|jgi:hypothetical protein
MTRPDFDTVVLPPDPPSSGEPLTVMYDTEFTSLTSDADLMSLGFTALDFDAELYIEIADANLAIASHFVRTEVLPLFGQHNPEVLTRDQAAVRIAEWLDELREGHRNRQIVLASGSPLDWQFFLELFIPLPGQPSWASEFNLVGRLVSSLLDSGRQHQAYTEAVEAYFRSHPGSRHHALVDARSMREGVRESRYS